MNDPDFLGLERKFVEVFRGLVDPLPVARDDAEVPGPNSVTSAPPTYPPEITELMAIAEQRQIENERLKRENSRLRAEREPGEYLSLRKALARLNREVGCEYETARTWCRDGLIDCYQERVEGRNRGRWMVYYPSLERHAKRRC